MIFEALPGNESIKTYLRKGIEKETLHHTLLFSSSREELITLFAQELAQVLLEKREPISTHPDLHIYRPEGKAGAHSIDTIREFIEEIHKPPFEAKRKVFILHTAERMVPAAANALLKTLEEPELDSTIILLSTKPQELLPTLVSRCAHLMVQDFSGEEENRSRRPDELIVLVLEGRFPLFRAIEEIETLWEDKEGLEIQKEMQNLFTAYLMWVRTQEMKKIKDKEAHPAPCLQKAVTKVIKIQKALERNVKYSACLYQLLVEL